MTTPRLHLWLPFLAVAACSSQLLDLEGVDSHDVSGPTDNPDSPADCADCTGSAVPNTRRRSPETRAAVRVGVDHTVSLSIEFAPAPPPTPSMDCSALTLTVVGSRTAALGESLSLHAYAGELQSAELAYEWLGSEQLEVTAEDSASFHCESPGEYELVLRLISPEACSTELPFTIACVEAE